MRNIVPDLHYNMMVVLAPCRRGIWAYHNYKMVLVLADLSRKMKMVLVPCRRDMVADLNYRLWWWCLPARGTCWLISTTRCTTILAESKDNGF